MDRKSIFYLDQDYQATYWLVQENVKISKQVTIPQAIQLLKDCEFDLIISDPQKLAILKPFSNESVPDSEGGQEKLLPQTLFGDA
jgi:hypothetical protein